MQVTNTHKVINTDNAPEAIGPYNQAKVAHDTLYIAGQIGMFPATEGRPGELVAEDIREQAVQVLKNVGAILEEAQFLWSEVVSTTVYITSFDDYAVFNKIYEETFEANSVSKEELPARAVVQVAGLPKGAKVEMQAIAVKK